MSNISYAILTTYKQSIMEEINRVPSLLQVNESVNAPTSSNGELIFMDSEKSFEIKSPIISLENINFVKEIGQVHGNRIRNNILKKCDYIQSVIYTMFEVKSIKTNIVINHNCIMEGLVGGFENIMCRIEDYYKYSIKLIGFIWKGKIDPENDVFTYNELYDFRSWIKL